MARQATGPSGPPKDQPSTSPQQLYPVADIRFVMVEIGKLTVQVERLISDVGKHGEKIDRVSHQISFVKGAIWVIGGLIVIFGAIFVWYLKDKIGVS